MSFKPLVKFIIQKMMPMILMAILIVNNLLNTYMIVFFHHPFHSRIPALVIPHRINGQTVNQHNH